MKDVRIAFLQISPCGSTEKNIEKGIECCRRAKELGADIALFPEMWSNGYGIYGRPAAEWTAEAVPPDGCFSAAFSRIAEELEMAVCITLLERTEGAPANTLLLYDRNGNVALRYSKVHTCDFDAERNLSRGNDFPVCTLDTASGNLSVGAMICFDREFPESARILMLRGAELILVPNACPMEVNRLAQLRARAFENMVAIATCNYPEGVPDCNGHSTLFDGIAWRESGDMCVFEAEKGEGVFVAAADIAALRRYRAEEVFGNAYRRPALYSDMVKRRVRSPFRRPDARR